MEKIATLDLLPSIIHQLKQANKTIVLAGGVFDVIHPAHIKFLELSKKEGDSLMLLLESDEAVQKTKGPDRPLFTQADRAYVLSALTVVDYIVMLSGILKDEDYLNLAKRIKPAIITATEGDPFLIQKGYQAQSTKGKLKIIMPKKNGYSTSYLLEKIKNL